MTALELRRQRLTAEASDLQRTMRLNGFVPGAPCSWSDLEANPECLQAQSRLWYIGYALSHPELPEVPA